ncbi:hypothetical protein AB0N62_42165 [Streptomyces sp. NPDC093982]|uniref:hypothetical protein n=1 Tax=Streptomyces sp. NPDC093982 TaxID=3155077 RepID=UPI00341536B1
MTTVTDDPIRDAGTALAILEERQQYPTIEVLEAAYAVPIHLRRALAPQWQTLPLLDRADLYALRIACQDVEQLGSAAMEKDGPARLAPIITEGRYFLGIADPTRQTDTSDRDRAVRRAATNIAVYERLREADQAAVLGQLTPPDATTARLLSALPDYVAPLPAPVAGAQLETVLSEAEKRTGSEDEPPSAPDRLALSMRKGMANLAGEWQQQIMRRIGAGVTPIDAIRAALRAHIRAFRHEDQPQA